MIVGGDDIQGDKHVHGDEVGGDKVAGNQVQTGNVTVSGGTVNVAGGNIIQRFYNFLAGDTEAQRAFRNRQNMLQLVWNTWIEGVLKKSLHNEVLIELGMETRPDAVEHPWDMVMQMPDREPEMVTPGTTMLELFDQANGSLLILGEPGSGKTTMLLELARLAILRAQEDPLQPIPVVFNLSSWRLGQKLAEWLVDELKGKYYVSPKIGQSWVDKGELLLLLDGLDEVGIENRKACVLTINAFQAEHSMPLVVCSRREEYEGLATHLNLRGAMLIHQLSEEQVDGYLQKAGAGLTVVRQVLMQDAELREFAQTPLILSILVLTYRDVPEAGLRALEAEGDCRQQLFDAYICQMFGRRSIYPGYMPEQTRKQLAWLAQKMSANSQSVLVIENISSNWLETLWQRNLYRLIVGLIVGLPFGLIEGLSFGLIAGPIEGPIFGLGFGLIFGLIVWRIVGRRDWAEPVDKLHWSWPKARQGLIFGLSFGLVAGLIGRLIGGLIGGLVGGLIGGLGGGLSGGLRGGLSSSAIENRSTPVAGIGASIRNAAIVGLSAWLIFGLIVVLIIGPVVGVIFGLGFGLIIGLIFGLSFGLGYGGGFTLSHFSLRWLLYRSDCIPWDIISFLDYCTERIFLRKVGGGYIFIHRMLMEHFAEMDEERIKALAQKT